MDQDETIGMDRGLGPGHIVLDGDPDPPKGHNPNFGPMSVVAKRLDGGRPQPRRHCVIYGRPMDRADHIYFHAVVCSYYGRPM